MTKLFAYMTLVYTSGLRLSSHSFLMLLHGIWINNERYLLGPELMHHRNRNCKPVEDSRRLASKALKPLYGLVKTRWSPRLSECRAARLQETRHCLSPEQVHPCGEASCCEVWRLWQGEGKDEVGQRVTFQHHNDPEAHSDTQHVE